MCQLEFKIVSSLFLINDINAWLPLINPGILFTRLYNPLSFRNCFLKLRQLDF